MNWFYSAFSPSCGCPRALSFIQKNSIIQRSPILTSFFLLLFSFSFYLFFSDFFSHCVGYSAIRTTWILHSFWRTVAKSWWRVKLNQCNAGTWIGRKAMPLMYHISKIYKMERVDSSWFVSSHNNKHIHTDIPTNSICTYVNIHLKFIYKGNTRVIIEHRKCNIHTYIT